MPLLPSNNATPSRRRVPTSLAIRRKQHRYRSTRSTWMTYCCIALIGVLVVLQFTALTLHDDPAQHDLAQQQAPKLDHRHASSIHEALREQRQQHQAHTQKQLDELQDNENRDQSDGEATKRRDRRRLLNETNKTRRVNETGGTPKAAVDKSISQAVVTPARAPSAGLGGFKAVDLLNARASENTARDVEGRDGAVTKVVRNGAAVTIQSSNVTGNMTTINGTQQIDNTVRNKVTTPPRPFKFKRSVPKTPPSDFQYRTMPIDPLSPQFDLSTLTPTNYTLRSKWHGVLLDAGRHYFEVDWIKRMLDVLSVLQYNSVQFRLTDDQAFNVKLDSQPDLAHNVGLFGNTKTYSPAELRDIVAYGKTKNITIWPEINVPGHGGGWAGIPGLVVQCPNFICEKGYGVPINVTHPKFRGILTDILREIVDIFDEPPYLHLGGDEVDMSRPCFEEFGEPMFNYDVFEKTIQQILKDIDYPEDQVIRWEMTGQRLHSQRAGKMPQYWFRVPGESAPNWGHDGFLASGGLYFDFNEMDMAWQIYLATRRYYHLPNNNFPVGIVVGGFELDSNFWYDRNVVGRLLAVTMGASKEVNADTGDELYSMYSTACKRVGFEDALCSHYGLPFISWNAYKAKWSDVWKKWIGRICDRLTTPEEEIFFVQHTSRKGRRIGAREGDAPRLFWDHFGTTENTTKLDLKTNDRAMEWLKYNANLTALMNRIVKNTGIIMDLTLNDQESQVIGSQREILNHMHAMGFNLIQLRLADDHAFAFQSTTSPNAFAPPGTFSPSLSILKDTIVREATRLGIGIIPEITLTTHAAGMYKMGYNIPCPKFTCKTGRGVQDISAPEYVSVAYGLIREVKEIATTGMIHLGSDERMLGQECYTEVSEGKLDFDSFEKKLSYLLKYDDIRGDQIIRWSNDEAVDYPGRLGSITQCREGDCRTDKTGKWFATVDLQKGGPYDIYNSARELAMRNPSAMLGEIGQMSSAAVYRHHIPMRILAFAMGTSDMHEWSRGMFEGSFVQLCSVLFGKNDDCKSFAQSDQGIPEAAERAEDHRSRVCTERTESFERHIFRPEYQERAVSVEIQAT